METNQLSRARTAFKRAVFVLGGQAKMAELLGISQQAVSHRMIRTNAPVQTPRELDLIEAATGISRHELRPDLYPLEERAPATQPAPHPAPTAQHPAAPRSHAQHPAAHPSAPDSPPLLEEGADGSAPGSETDPLKGLAA